MNAILIGCSIGFVISVFIVIYIFKKINSDVNDEEELSKAYAKKVMKGCPNCGGFKITEGDFQLHKCKDCFHSWD